MRISVFPKGDLDELVAGEQPVTGWIARAADLPVDGVELYSRFFLDGPPDLASRVGDALAHHGLELPMLCASPDFAHPDPEIRARELDDEIAMIELTRELGGPGASCRVLSGQRHPHVDPEQAEEWVVDAFLKLLPVAVELDVVLGFENHYKDGFWTYPEFAQSKERYRRILDRIPRGEHFGVQFDPSNALVAGDDPVDFLREVLDRVVTVQASDRYLAEGASMADLAVADGSQGYADVLRHGVIGQGLNDYPEIFGTLAAAGYDGWVSIEDGVNGWDDLRASVEFLRDARQRYFNGSTRAGRDVPVVPPMKGAEL
ncbi:myo-inositol catabolism protein IolH [Luteimicrobium album]|uniref:Myo-inositol catabolism protein IolH n=1 Tax=Luteimicrobium album TaxID=1054550 RepID=A0ABQ6I0Z1_9MICO|nr:sugar phosphate isomerase/epimerase family protein [Luteimicrobium album]GMA24431.1 myo-inositol catabolism protein IolH [Luteimicrobium album]